MKKKIIIGLFIIIGLLITGCTSKKVTPKYSDVSIGNYDIDLNETSEFNDLVFKYPKDANYGNFGTFALIELNDSNNLIVRVALSYYEGKTVEQVMEGTTLTKKEQIKYNNINWDAYEGIENDNQIVTNFVSQINGDVYSIAFISNEDIYNFVNVFMNNVTKK